MRLATARGEAEAVQLVVLPERELRGFTAQSDPLRSPGGDSIAAELIDILRVRYVQVVQPTDKSGAPGLWPDPLPPLMGALTLPAGRNQALWIRVKASRGIRAGEYAGAIRLKADGYSAEAALKVRVFDFELPERMRCATAFGFSPGVQFYYYVSFATSAALGIQDIPENRGFAGPGGNWIEEDLLWSSWAFLFS